MPHDLMKSGKDETERTHAWQKYASEVSLYTYRGTEEESAKSQWISNYFC